MATSVNFLNVRTRDVGVPFNFPDGLAVEGVLLNSKEFASKVGCLVKPTDTVTTMLQDWIFSVATSLAALKAGSTGGSSSLTAPDKPTSDNSSFIANTHFVQALLAEKLALLVGSAPAPLNTIAGLAAAINNDPNFAVTLNNSLLTKASLSDVQSGQSTFAVAGGTAAAITATFAPAVTQLVNGMVVRFRASAPNATTAVTFTPNNGVIPAAPISKGTRTDIDVGDIYTAGYPVWLQWDATASRWVMINPAYGVNSKWATSADTQAGLLTDAAVTPAGLKDTISALVGVAPAVLNQINEIALAINNDPNFYTTMMNQIATRAPIDSPFLTGAPKAPTPTAGDNSKNIATTEYVQKEILQMQAGGGVPSASTTVAGIARFATAAELTAGTAPAAIVSPQALLSALGAYATLFSPVFTGTPQAPTPAAGDNSKNVATTEFVTRATSSLPQGNKVTPGLVRFATSAELTSGTSPSVVVSPLDLETKLAALPAVPAATETVVGKTRLATSLETIAGLMDAVAVHPKGLKAAIDAAIANIAPAPTPTPTPSPPPAPTPTPTPPPPAPVTFAAPVVTSGAAFYSGVPHVFGFTAVPVNGASSIVSFTVTTSIGSGGRPQVTNQTIPATSNGATFTATTAARTSGVMTVTALATDNLGAVSVMVTLTYTVTGVTVSTPSITAPLAGASDVATTATFTVSGFGISYGTGTHQSTNWALADATGVSVWSKNSTTDLLSITPPAGTMSAGQAYTLTVMFNDSVYGQSGANSNTFTTQAAPGVETAKVVLPTVDGQSGANFGNAVALSANGSYMVVGASLLDVNGVTDCGSAYIYFRSGSTWVLQANLKYAGAGGWEKFGFSVAINDAGDRVLVCTATGSGGQGDANFYTRTGTTWALEAKVTYSPYDSWIQFGACCAMNAAGDRAVVGAPYERNGGAAFTYKRTNGVWAMEQRLALAAPVVNDGYATGVEMSSDGLTIIIGAPYIDQGVTDGGAAYIYTFAAGVWGLNSTIMAADRAQYDYFANAVSLSGDGNYLAIAAWAKTVNATNHSGQIYMYKRTGSTWTFDSALVSPTPLMDAYWGYSVGLNFTGTKCVVGCMHDTVNGVQWAGTGYLFARDTVASAWKAAVPFFSHDPSYSSMYGYSCDISQDGSVIAMGAVAQNGSVTTGEGAVYTYTG